MARREHAHGQRPHALDRLAVGRRRRVHRRDHAASPSRVGMPLPMTASAAASRPASGIQAATWPGLWPGVGTSSTVRPPSSSACVARPASAPANGGAGAVDGALGGRLAERHVVVHGEARVALADRCARDRPRAARRAPPASTRAPGLAASSSAVPPRWSLSGCVMSTISSRSPRRATSGSSSSPRRRPAGPCRRPARPRRRRSRPARTMRGPSSCSQLQMPVGELVDHCGCLQCVEQAADDGGAIVAARPTTCSWRGRPRRTRSARSKVSRAANGNAIGVIARALDEQLLEALGEGPAGGARDALVERGREQRDQAERAPGPRSRCAAR